MGSVAGKLGLLIPLKALGASRRRGVYVFVTRGTAGSECIDMSAEVMSMLGRCGLPSSSSIFGRGAGTADDGGAAVGRDEEPSSLKVVSPGRLFEVSGGVEGGERGSSVWDRDEAAGAGEAEAAEDDLPNWSLYLLRTVFSFARLERY